MEYLELGDQALMQEERIHTIFCSTLSDVATWWTLIRHAFIILLIAGIAYAIFNLYVIREEHPVKQRAPGVALFHLSLTFIYVMVLYILEWLPLQQWKADTPDQIPLFRKITQRFVAYLRASFVTVYLVRTLVIFCQWKCTFKSRKFTLFLAKESNAIWCYLGISLTFLIFGLVFDINGIGLFYPSLNWYIPGQKENYIFLNLGLFSMVEITLLCGCYYLLRQFPNNFGVKKEAMWMCATCFVCTFLSNMLNPFDLGDRSHKCKKNFPPYFIPQFNFEFLRVLSLTLTLWIFNQPLPMIPPVPTRQLNDFRVFTSNPLCIKAFKEFIPMLHCNLVTEQFEEFMRLQLAGSIRVSSSNCEFRGSDPRKNIPTQLNNAFLCFQETHSFGFIKEQLEQYERVFHLRFKMMML